MEVVTREQPCTNPHMHSCPWQNLVPFFAAASSYSARAWIEVLCLLVPCHAIQTTARLPRCLMTLSSSPNTPRLSVRGRRFVSKAGSWSRTRDAVNSWLRSIFDTYARLHFLRAMTVHNLSSRTRTCNSGAFLPFTAGQTPHLSNCKRQRGPLELPPCPHSAAALLSLTYPTRFHRSHSSR